jgi:hypothetical protein
MTASGCPFRAMPLVTADVDLFPVVLDAEALLPPEVAAAAAVPTSFHSKATDLLGTMAISIVRPVELEERLLRLAGLAAAHVAAFNGQRPTHDESEAVSLAAAGFRLSEVAERVRYDHFFAIRRAAHLDIDTLARSIFEVLATTLEDVARTQLGHHEILALLHGIVEATRWIESVDEPSPVPTASSPATPLRRFVLGHHLFALMANFARHHVRAVAVEPTAATAADDLLRASQYVRASTSAMWHAVSFPPAAYRDLVRPKMDAASSDEHGFSGGDNFDFRRLRESWEDLHRALLMSWDDLDGSTRDAARLLFETVVLDNEHHTALAAEMVGLLASLNADRHARRLAVHAMSAVSSLRHNTDDRRSLLDQLHG